jgi:ketosteroid isomerase-like protein
MTRENLDIVRRSWEGFMKGDAAALAVLDSEVVYEDDLLPENAGETYRGVKGMQEAWSVWREPWDVLETEIEWVRAAGTDQVVPAIERGCAARGAASKENVGMPTCGDFGRARSSTTNRSGIQVKPSTPQNCRSRRCRRRTPNS